MRPALDYQVPLGGGGTRALSSEGARYLDFVSNTDFDNKTTNHHLAIKWLHGFPSINPELKTTAILKSLK